MEETLSGHKILYPLLKQREVVLEKMTHEYTDDIYKEYDDIETTFNQHDGYTLEGDADKLLVGLSFTRKDLSKNPKDFFRWLAYAYRTCKGPYQ